MGEIFSSAWLFMIPTLLFIIFLAKFVHENRKKVGKSNQKFPPGGRGWPIIGDSVNWYNAVASSHPPSFVEEQIKRFLLKTLHLV